MWITARLPCGGAQFWSYVRLKPFCSLFRSRSKKIVFVAPHWPGRGSGLDGIINPLGDAKYSTVVNRIEAPLKLINSLPVLGRSKKFGSQKFSPTPHWDSYFYSLEVCFMGLHWVQVQTGISTLPCALVYTSWMSTCNRQRKKQAGHTVELGISFAPIWSQDVTLVDGLIMDSNKRQLSDTYNWQRPWWGRITGDQHPYCQELEQVQKLVNNSIQYS